MSERGREGGRESERGEEGRVREGRKGGREEREGGGQWGGLIR